MSKAEDQKMFFDSLKNQKGLRRAPMSTSPNMVKMGQGQRSGKVFQMPAGKQFEYARQKHGL